MSITDLQEPPAGKPWEREWVRTWEPAPFDRSAYEAWSVAEHAERTGVVRAPCSVPVARLPYLDEVELSRPWFR